VFVRKGKKKEVLPGIKKQKFQVKIGLNKNYLI
jgi:hypothetical protein